MLGKIVGRIRTPSKLFDKSPQKAAEEDAAEEEAEADAVAGPYDWLTYLISFEFVVLEGKLSWYDRPNKTWLARWFVLYPGALLWWSTEEANKGDVQGLLPLEAVSQVVEHGDAKKQRFNLVLSLRDSSGAIEEAVAEEAEGDAPPPPAPKRGFRYTGRSPSSPGRGRASPPPDGAPSSPNDKDGLLSLRAKNEKLQQQWREKLGHCIQHTARGKSWPLSKRFFLDLPAVVGAGFEAAAKGWTSKVTQELQEAKKKREAEMEKEDENYKEEEEVAKAKAKVVEDTKAPQMRAAAEKKDVKTVQSLLAKKASPDGADMKTGNTALMEACREGALDKLFDGQYGLDAGLPWSVLVYAIAIAIAMLCCAVLTGNTALMEACRVGALEVVEALLAAKAGVDHQDIEGNSALMYAETFSHHKIMTALLQAKADPNLRDHDGEVVLMKAAAKDREANIKLLLDAGAKANLQDGSGETALMHATRHGLADSAK
eukprot:g23164.t1